MPLERKTPVVYPDGTYEIVPEQPRGNVLLISNATQHGLSGRGSVRRTAFFTFFGRLGIKMQETWVGVASLSPGSPFLPHR